MHGSSPRPQTLSRIRTDRVGAARATALAVAAAACLACRIAAAADEVSVAPLPNPISEPQRPWAFDGFVLTPPSGGEWYSLVKSRDRVVFARRAYDPSYLLVAAAHTAHLDQPPATPGELVELVRRRAPRLPDTLRYEIKEHAAELDTSAPWCVRYRHVAEDSRESFFYPYIVQITGRVCAHPEERGLLVDASVAERAIEGDSRPKALKEGEAFLAGLRFTPINPTAVARADALIAEGRLSDALKVLTPLAEHGNARAAKFLGAAYERGQGVAPDLAEASHWYQIAAEAGEVDALYNLGALHEHANGSSRDAQEALRWFRRAADQRDAQAQLNIGLLYLKGEGVDKDPRQARFWIGLAAGNGSPRARTLLRELFP